MGSIIPMVEPARRPPVAIAPRARSQGRLAERRNFIENLAVVHELQPRFTRNDQMKRIERPVMRAQAQRASWIDLIRKIAVQGGGADVICDYATRIAALRAKHAAAESRLVLGAVHAQRPGMKKYQLPRLNEKTPAADQSRIVAAVKGVSGVTKAVLHPNSQELEVAGKDQTEPKREDIATAVSKIGFPLGSV